MAELTDINIGQGESFKQFIQLLNRSDNNSSVDLTDFTIEGSIRENYTTDIVAARFSFEKCHPYTSGAFFMFLSPDITMNMEQRSYVYDVKITNSSGSISRRVLEGKFTVRPSVTRD